MIPKKERLVRFTHCTEKLEANYTKNSQALGEKSTRKHMPFPTLEQD